MRIARRAKSWLIIAHRWLGIVTCLAFAIWFLSGLVMMYVGFPALTDAERLAAAPAIAWDRVGISPDAAMAAAGLARYPRELRLAMLDDEPVYRALDWDGSRRTVSAADGRAIERVGAQQALAIARRHPRAARVELEAVVERDQWSVTARYDPLRPFYLASLGDESGTQLYISARTGETALDTTRKERFWNWLGAVPHWIYLTPLRAQAGLWRDVVLWISGIGVLVAASGIWIGVLAMCRSRRHGGRAVTPYRGWMAWHHAGGLVGGLALLTWIVSGWLSLNPNNWFGTRALSSEMLMRYAGNEAARFNPDLAALKASLPAGAAEVRFAWLDAVPVTVPDARSGTAVRHGATGAPAALTDERLFAAAERLMPTARLVLRARLTEEDRYWYSHHHARPLPVLRAGFDDEARTWFHIDPRSGEILERTDETRRAYRWLFNALHSLDFAFLLRRRPAWDLVVWLLSVAGLIISMSGVVIGWRRLGRLRAG